MEKPKISKIDKNTWIFDEEGVRFFLLAGDSKALLIDSGMTTHNAKELAKELTDLPIELLNTHADIDHIGSNHEFASFYMNPKEANNYYSIPNSAGTILPVEDGDILDLGNRKLKIIEIPGHTPGSIAVLDEKNRRLFSGDPIQTGRIFMFGPQRDMNNYGLGLLKVKSHISEFDEIYPSHGSYSVKPELIDKLYEASENLLKGNISGKEDSMFGKPIIDYDVGYAHFLLDPK